MEMMHEDSAESYSRIHPFMVLFASQNPNAVVALDRDSENCFYRCFMSSPVASYACGEHAKCKKLLGADGTHFRHQHYNGILLSLHTIDGDDHTLLVAVAIVPVESEEHWHWFFSLCCKSGVVFGNKVLFVDRDKGSIAASSAMAVNGIKMNMRWCTQHIIGNCIDKFGISTNDVQFRAYVIALQRAMDVDQHHARMQAIASEYGEGVAEYLCCINPTSWMQYANCNAFTEQIQNWQRLSSMDVVNDNDAICNMLHSSVQDESITNLFLGTPMCMYGVKDTNFVEGQNAIFMKSGFRDCLPYKSIRCYQDYMVQQTFERNEKAKTWIEENCVLTPYAQQFYDNEKLKTGQCDANQVSITDDLETVTVWDTYRLSTQYSVNIKEVKCQCTLFDQIGIVCRHLLFAMKLCNKTFNVYEYFDTCYLVESYADAF